MRTIEGKVFYSAEEVAALVKPLHEYHQSLRTTDYAAYVNGWREDLSTWCTERLRRQDAEIAKLKGDINYIISGEREDQP